jgi:hypothetical protein
VRRLSVASLDSGAELSVYCAAPSASADGGDTAAAPLRAIELGVPRYPVNGGRVGSAESACLSAPSAAHHVIFAPAVALAHAGRLHAFSQARASGDPALLRRVPCRAAGWHVARGRAARDTPVANGLMPSGQVRSGVPRLATTCDMSVVDRQSARWYVKDIRASTQPMGTQ